VDALRAKPCAVLRAPAGAGKTTRVPPALLDAGLAGRGMVVVLEPRRVAARAAARRIAWERGAELGGEVGWHVRFDRKSSRATRLLVVTEGVLLRRLQDDPFLEDVGALVFDEFHERSLASDLSLAMARRLQRDARPDLCIVVMSATLETAPVAAYLGAPVVESEGFLHPVEVRHLDQPDARRTEDVCADGVRRALAATTGDVLAFLPGLGEIRRTAERLAADAARLGADVLELHGELPPEKQDAALRPGPRRRVVLATNVAETSVTVEGVTAVVDTGWARVMRHDPAVGMDRLVLTRIARSSIEQRTGRAGRVAPGTCFRLWTRNEERTFPERLEPEVRRVDLAGAALELLAWGETDLAAFPWFEAPETARLASATDLLRRLGAVDADGRVTDTGRALVRIPVHPREARMLVEGARLGQVARVALAAALLAERDPFRVESRRRGAVHHSDSDVLDRVDALEQFEARGHRHFDVGEIHPGGAEFVLRAAQQLERAVEAPERGAAAARASPDSAVLRAVFAGYPDRLARRRGEGERRGVLVTGGGVRLADESAVADAELFVCVDMDAGAGSEALVRKASAVRREWLPAERITTTVDVGFDDTAFRVVAWRRSRFDELVLDEHAAALPDDGRVEATLAEAAARDLPRALDLASKELESLRGRVAFLREHAPDLGLPALDDDALRAALPDLCAGRRSFDELRRAPLVDVLRARLDRRQLATLDREAPEFLTVPSGSRVALRWEPGRQPVLAVRIQEVFGWADTPRVAGGRVKVLLELLGPNYRPQQVTDDLRSFWTNTYPEVRKELKRRYPRHAWPEDPWTAQPERRPRRR
jgi:ATP-dependent helicase HrpB